MRIDIRGLFGDGIDVRKAWTFFEACTELYELRERADGVSLDAAVAQIADVAAEAEALGFADGEKTVANTLHAAGDEEARSSFFGVHKLWNCSESVEGCQVAAARDFVE